MALIAVLLLGQVAPTDIDRWARDLGHELLEVRERAHRRLLEIGEPALPTLRAATCSEDAEIRFRAKAIMEVTGRMAREREHDADQKAALLSLRRNPEAERRPGSGTDEGARFDLSATPFGEGWIISTIATNYLARFALEEPGKGRLHFDIKEIAGADARGLNVERCGRCSPQRVFVRSAGGPFTARIVGSQVWYSPYHLEFQSPSVGQRIRVGDFTIEVAWPSLKVTADREFPKTWLWSMENPFDTALKEGIDPERFKFSRGSCRYGAGGTFMRPREKRHWCDCPNGPQPTPTPLPIEVTSEFMARRDVSNDKVAITFPEAWDFELPLDFVSKISYTFWKPIEIPIDVNVILQTR